MLKPFTTLLGHHLVIVHHPITSPIFLIGYYCMHYIGKGEKDLFVVGVLVEIGFKLPKLVPIV